jgi:uncharacterized SAM-binding protein YcdF (DUF218 family)
MNGMPGDSGGQKARKGKIALLILAACVVAFLFALRNAGRWLVREDPLAKADVIVVLSGGLPTRAQEAAKLFVMGYATEIWISRPESPGGELKELRIHYVGEEEYDHDIVVRKGVPESAVHIFRDSIVDTEEEVQETARDMRQQGKNRVIFVTSPEHTRRVKALWRTVAWPGASAILRAAADDPFDSDHWWRNTRDALSVAREYLGLMNVWAGSPVRPRSR